MRTARQWATPITAGAALLLSVTGVLMFFHADTGLNKTAHEWLSWLFLAGTAVFSGTLWALVLSDMSALGAITPLGGLLLLGGWIACALSARSPAAPQPGAKP